MNPHRGYCQIKIGDKAFDLKFDMNAIACLEDTLGQPILELFRADANGVYDEHAVGRRLASARFAIALVHAGLQHDKRYRGMTPRKVSVLLDSVGMTGLAEVITPAVQAFMRAFGVDLEAKEIEGEDQSPLAPAPALDLDD